MRLEIDPADLQPIVELTVLTVLAQLAPQLSRINDRIGATEPEAAKLLGIPRHSLRDARLRGEIKASKIGKRIVYSRESLTEFLVKQRIS